MRDTQKFVCRDPGDQAQYMRATFVTCTARKTDDRWYVAEEVFDLFAGNTFWVVGMA